MRLSRTTNTFHDSCMQQQFCIGIGTCINPASDLYVEPDSSVAP